ncbi:MAG: DUF6922 domain-containing protein [Bacteroidales bacterium]
MEKETKQPMQEKLWDISQFSKHLFWDVDISTLSQNKNKPFIVKRVLEYGLLSDWLLLNKYMTISEIAEEAKALKELDCKTLSFISTISRQPRSSFRCYTTKHSTSQHWNF